MEVEEEVQPKTRFMEFDHLIWRHQPVKNDFKIVKKITESYYGPVYLVECKKSKQRYCLKMFYKSRMKVRAMVDFKTEAEILKDLDHMNIYKTISSVEDKESFYHISEYLPGGELFDEIVREAFIDENTAKMIMTQIFSAIKYLHSVGVTHRDLKPENIMLKQKGSISYIKIIDFGFAKRFKADTVFTDVVGTCYYIAPEIFKGSYNEKIDIWSAGVLLYILLSGKPPFNGTGNDVIYHKIINTEPSFKENAWNFVSSDGIELVKAMLTKDPSKRLTADQIFNSKWIQSGISRISLTPTSKIQAQLVFSELKRTNGLRKLENSLRIIIAQYLDSKDEEKRLNELFNVMDLDGDGFLCQNELAEIIQEVELVMESGHLLTLLDMNNDKKVSWKEFCVAFINLKSAISREIFENIFQEIDTNNDLMISKEELGTFFDIESDNPTIKKLVEDFGQKDSISKEDFMKIYDDHYERVIEEKN